VITFLVTVDDLGDTTIRKLSGLSQSNPGQDPGELLDRLCDRTFQRADMKVGDRIDLHVNVDGTTRRNVVISLLDDTIPQFSSIEEAERWMESRQSGQYSIQHG
jgi:hypothetical protein